MLIRVWEYEVVEGSVSDFEQTYGSEGPWARLFESAAGFVGSELFRSTSTPGRYVTIDRFSDAESWRQFLTDHRDAYEKLDALTAGLTLSERASSHRAGLVAQRLIRCVS